MGLDPAWGLATNKLTFTNGIKMKVSVIMGVMHMVMGILHKGTNCVYFRDWASLVTEVIVGLIILLGLFGWMNLLIIAKWFHIVKIDDDTIHAGGLETEGQYINRLMPSVTNLMIDTVFNFGKSKNDKF